ncbi:exodeoxyribonuclease-like [Saccoglossus kowalevskii]|uniref:DNA repair nuclease/redox regulator APEX1 n=1 Tax=Saccoglossus kowalevskii TaxID=10224 RepID=A0ABM0GJ66_SACKO|nr:PREDICTED: DNA-(apurinic or apyrimidinic site) lyase-like [Saccoglossus kowalevskii]
MQLNRGIQTLQTLRLLNHLYREAIHRLVAAINMPPKRKSNDSDAMKTKKTKVDNKEAKGAGSEKPTLDSLDFSLNAKTTDGKEWNIKLVSWNVNGVRAWCKNEGHKYVSKEDPDIFTIQETKCQEGEVPDDVKFDGYHSYWSYAEEKGYAGTGLYSKVEPISVTYGIGINKHDKEGRCITAEYEKFYFISTYIPNAGKGLKRLSYRQEWDKDFREYMKKLDEKKPIIWCGDLNVAHQEIDLTNPKTNKKTAGFSKEEREGFTKHLEIGLVDSYRHLNPEKTGEWSFWTYMMNARGKNIGWRLDYFVLSKRLLPCLCDSIIRSQVYGSDHAPIVLFMAF